MIIILNKNMNNIKSKIQRQQAKHDKMFMRQEPTTFKKRTVVTYSRSTMWLPINHARAYYTHVKYTL